MKIRNLKFHFLEGDPEGELWTSLFCWDLSLLMLWHDNLYNMSNSDIIFVVICDWTAQYHVINMCGNFKRKLLCNTFSNLTSRMWWWNNTNCRHTIFSSKDITHRHHLSMHCRSITCYVYIDVFLQPLKFIEPQKLVDD